MNVIEGLQAQMNRCRDLLKVYEELGPVGSFGATFIRDSIEEGEASIASGDVLRMLAAHERLKDHS